MQRLVKKPCSQSAATEPQVPQLGWEDLFPSAAAGEEAGHGTGACRKIPISHPRYTLLLPYWSTSRLSNPGSQIWVPHYRGKLHVDIYWVNSRQTIHFNSETSTLFSFGLSATSQTNSLPRACVDFLCDFGKVVVLDPYPKFAKTTLNRHSKSKVYFRWFEMKKNVWNKIVYLVEVFNSHV
jgi:hypothetical protein